MHFLHKTQRKVSVRKPVNNISVWAPVQISGLTWFSRFETVVRSEKSTHTVTEAREDSPENHANETSSNGAAHDQRHGMAEEEERDVGV